MNRLRHRIFLFLALPALCAALPGCLGNSGSGTAPPIQVHLYAGDTAISATWNDDPSIQYWLFHAQDPTLSTLNWSTLLNAGVLVNAASPAILCRQVNNTPSKSYFPDVFVTVNGRTGTAPGGPGSPLVNASPRPAGGAEAPWIPGPAIPSVISGLGYAPITGCGYAGRPASGMLVAVGPAATIYYSVLAPTVAGPLTVSQGNSPLVWAPANTPAGFSEDLAAVAGYTQAGSNPAAPAFVFVAVGKLGTILRSVDGRNWYQVSIVPTSANLNDVASTGGSFVAVGDGGVVLTSTDGVTWTLNTTAAAISSSPLKAVHCSGATCVAVGDGGTTLWSSHAGSDWTSYPVGSNNWIAVAYGNNNFNADSIVTESATGTPVYGNPNINTWIVVDALGNYAFALNGSGSGLVAGTTPIATSLAAIDYSSRFVALDGAGNSYVSENGYNWRPGGPSSVQTPKAMRSNGLGYIAIGTNGSNSTSF